jgi:hypothetical protein
MKNNIIEVNLKIRNFQDLSILDSYSLNSLVLNLGEKYSKSFFLLDDPNLPVSHECLSFDNEEKSEYVLFGEVKECQYFINKMKEKSIINDYKFVVFLNKNIMLGEDEDIHQVFYTNDFHDAVVDFKKLCLKSIENKN